MFLTIDKIFHNHHFIFNRLKLHYPFIIKLALPASHNYLTSMPKITFTL